MKSETCAHKVHDIFSAKYLCDIHVPVDSVLLYAAAGSSARSFETWSTMTTTSRSKILYKYVIYAISSVFFTN